MRVINLFSGCGGCSLGLIQAGFEVRLAADIDEEACETYAANLGKEAIWPVDLSNVGPDELLERSQLDLAQVDLIVGGPPCQGFSSAGAKDWADPRNILLRNFVEIVTSLRPTWFIMENVEGLLTANDGVFIIEAITHFLEAGYWVRAKKVYMEKHGLPQRRKRVIIVGNLEQCNFTFPEPTHYEQPALPTIEQRSQLTVLDAISDLPIPSYVNGVFNSKEPQCDYQRQLRRTDNKPILHHQIKRLNDFAQQRINLLKQGETMKDLPENLQHASFTRRSYRRVMDGTPTEKRGGAPSGLKRLFGHEPSLTITSASSTEFIHPTENRPLTLRECARIQSFPDWYEFSGSWNAIATQIGNAIPPMFMKLLATRIQNLATWHRVENPRGYWLGIDATKSNGISPALNKMLTELKEKTYAYALF
ncbi:MAG TPA: DNA cytosine methyltransferase [Ktedonobacteraceae bacterium]|nr:DNA cytosine methyltransferase [Ktedonobacteraceae bacterium]